MTGFDSTSRPRSLAARTALAWAAVFAGSLILAAALAPFVHAAVRALDLPRGWSFSRVFNRVAMAAALTALIALRRWTGWRELLPLLRRARPAEAAAEAVAGLCAGLIAVTAGVAWAFAVGRLGPPLMRFDFLALRTLSLVLGASLAALIEEVFFRGLMLGSLAARWRWTTAALVSSALYSAVHLLSSDRRFEVAASSPGTGFRYLGRALTGQLEIAALPPLFGLFLTGLVLALVVRRTDSLWLAVGLHSGLAASFQILRQASHVLEEIPGRSALATQNYLVGTSWAWASIALAGGLVFAGSALRERRQAARSGRVAPAPLRPARGIDSEP